MYLYAYFGLESLKDITDSIPTADEIDSSVQAMVNLREMVDSDVKKNVLVAQKRQKEQYDARHRKGEYKVTCCTLD